MSNEQDPIELFKRRDGESGTDWHARFMAVWHTLKAMKREARNAAFVEGAKVAAERDARRKLGLED